jgi:hypothetical protein
MKNRKEKNNRIFEGKYGLYQFLGMLPQKGGSVAKVKKMAQRTNPERGISDQIAFVEKHESSGKGSVVKEKICLDLYGEVAMTPSSRIALRTRDEMRQLLTLHPISEGHVLQTPENLVREQGGRVEDYTREKSIKGKKGVHKAGVENYLRDDLWVGPSGVGIVEDQLRDTPTYGNSRDDRRYATFLGKYVEGYSNLGEGFVDYIKQHHRPPDTIEKDGKQYSLQGIMSIAAMSKILGDPDWLGASGGNTGFVVKDGKAIPVVIDAGEALPPDHDDSRKGVDPRNIQIGKPLGPEYDIQFDKLSPEQKDEFIGTLFQFTNSRNIKEFVSSHVARDGEFNTQKDKNGKPIILLNKQEGEQMTQQITQNIKTLSETYKTELALYAQAMHDKTSQNSDQNKVASEKSDQNRVIKQSIDIRQERVIKRLDAQIARCQKRKISNPNSQRYDDKIAVLQATKAYVNGEIDKDALRKVTSEHTTWDKGLGVTKTEQRVVEALKLVRDRDDPGSAQNKAIRRIDAQIEKYEKNKISNPCSKRYDDKIAVLQATKAYINGEIDKSELRKVARENKKWDKGRGVTRTEDRVLEAVDLVRDRDNPRRPGR